MSQTIPFGEVLEAVDQLPPEDQQALVEILQRRLVQAGRQRVIAEVQEADEEFAEGKCVRTTTKSLMDEILG